MWETRRSPAATAGRGDVRSAIAPPWEVSQQGLRNTTIKARCCAGAVETGEPLQILRRARRRTAYARCTSPRDGGNRAPALQIRALWARNVIVVVRLSLSEMELQRLEKRDTERRDILGFNLPGHDRRRADDDIRTVETQRRGGCSFSGHALMMLRILGCWGTEPRQSVSCLIPGLSKLYELSVAPRGGTSAEWMSRDGAPAPSRAPAIPEKLL